MFGGSVIAWFALIPLIKFLGAGLAEPLFPSTKLISEMAAGDIWGSYIRYIGAGAVAMGGFISLARSLPTIIRSFKQAMAGIGNKAAGKIERINVEAPLTWVIGAAAFGFAGSWLIPAIGGTFLGALAAVLFSFFFSVVSARMVGVIGASNNPVSGMTIATLLFVTTLLKVTGNTGDIGMEKAFLIGGVVCVAIAVAGGTAQSLKTTYIIGGNPRNVQIGMFAALAVASVVAGLVVIMLDKAYTIGSTEAAAPQASLMKLIVEGIMTAQLPWTLVIIGASLAVFCALAGISILPVALGIYLPISLNAAILVGGIIRVLVEKKFKSNKEGMDASIEKGTLLSSGLVAGDALMGIVIAIFAVFNVNIGIGQKYFPEFASSSLVAFLAFIGLGVWIYLVSSSRKK
ncbi:OPT/YSL family transporter [Alloiococcus sp. CFN-8]|uniref:OPT/YSL family transporter n=1 Tax=Alloiococcus sp. CFN-8 TaxID=3416081 RepID=UPI003CFB9B92